jgi:predicted RecA/RadA family phage recombinase
MRNYLQIGDTVTVAAPAAVSSGDGVLVGTLFGIAANDADSAAEVEIKTRGVFEMPKTSAQAWTVGSAIYWNGSLCTTADGSGANTLIGKAMAVAANPSATGVVRLDG